MTLATRSLLVWLLLSAGLAGSAGALDSDSPERALTRPEPLTLDAVLDRVQSDHPDAAAARAVAAATAAERAQAGQLPNPVLSIELDNFAGSEALRGFDEAETTLRLEQLIEIGGQRAKRTARAAATEEMARRQQDLTRADLYQRTVESFMTLLAAQERLQLAEELQQGAMRTVEGVAAQIEAGKAPAVAAHRSRPLQVEARIEVLRARGALAAARTALATLLGQVDDEGLRVRGELAVLPQASQPSAPVVAPRISVAATERRQAEADVAVERGRRIPELTVGLGVRHFAADDATALVAGVSLPLPLFDRNLHGVAAAEARLEEARQHERGAQLQLAADLASAREELATARSMALALQDELVPAARQSYEAIELGYRAGKFSLLDLLDARRQLTAVQSELLAAQVTCHVAAARYDALRGALPLAPMQPQPTSERGSI